MKKQDILQLNRGMNTDSDPILLPEGFYLEANAAVLTNEGGDKYSINNENGFVHIEEFANAKPENLVITIEQFNNVIYIFSVNAITLASEIGKLENNNYNTIFNDADINQNTDLTQKLNFNINNKIFATFREIYNGDVICYFTDNLNAPKKINLNRDYNTNPFTSLNKQTNIFKRFNTAICSYKETLEGGNVKPGIYYFTVRYLDKDLNKTNFGLLSAGIPCVSSFRQEGRIAYDGDDFEEKVSAKSIKLDITNIDTAYEYLEIGVVTYLNASNTPSAYKLKTLRIETDSIEFVYDGRIEDELALSEIVDTKIFYERADTIIQKDNRLFLMDLQNDPFDDLQEIANSLTIKYQTEEIESKENYDRIDNLGNKEIKFVSPGSLNLTIDEGDVDAVNFQTTSFNDYIDEGVSANKKGYCSDEVYSFAIAGLLKNGGQTRAFHIPAFISTNNPTPGEHDENPSYTGVGNTSGHLKCFVSEDKYDDVRFLQTGVPYYKDQNGNTLHGQGIRHHLFPKHIEEPHYRVADDGTVYYRVFGIKIEGFATALKNHPKLKDKLSGIVVLREKRDTFSNKRIHSMGMVNPLSYWDGYKNNRNEDEPQIDATLSVNPLFGDTLLENSNGNQKTLGLGSGFNNCRYFNGANNPLQEDALSSGLFYSPESIFYDQYQFPISSKLIPVFKVWAHLWDNLPGRNVNYFNITTAQTNAYGIPVTGTVNVHNTSNNNYKVLPYLIDYRGIHHKEFVDGHYDPSSETGKLPRGYLWMFFGDFSKFNPIKIVSDGVVIQKVQKTKWNPEIINQEDINELTTIVKEKYKFNSYGTEPATLFECADIIPTPFEKTGQLGNIKADNQSFHPEHYTIRGHIEMESSNGGLNNKNGIWVFGTNNTDIPKDNDSRQGIQARNIYIVKNYIPNQYKQLDGNDYIPVEILLFDDKLRNSNELDVTTTRTLFGGDVFTGHFFFKTSYTAAYGFKDDKHKIWEDNYPDWDEKLLLPVFGPVYPGLQDRKGGSLIAGNYFIVQSEINVNYRHVQVQRDVETGEILKTGVPYFPKVNKVLACVPDAELGQSDGYNTTYSQENNIKTIKLETKASIENTDFSNRAIYSLKSFEGEQEDNYTNFLALSYYDFPRNKGRITNAFEFNGVVYVHTERGLFRTFINESTAITSNNSLNITLGETGVLNQTPKEIFTLDGGYAGCIHKTATTITPFGVAFFDYYQQKVFLLGESLSTISEEGKERWFAENSNLAHPSNRISNPFFGGASMYYDAYLKEIFLTLRSGGNFKTLNYNPASKGWVSFHPFTFNDVVSFNNRVVSVNNIDLFRASVGKVVLREHNFGPKGYFEGEIHPFNITAVFNTDPILSKIFDNLLTHLTVYTRDKKIVKIDKFFTKYKFHTNNKSTGFVDVVMESDDLFDINTRYLDAVYRTYVATSKTADENQDKDDLLSVNFVENSLPRLRDVLLFCTLEYDNSEDLHFVLKFLELIYRYSFRR